MPNWCMNKLSIMAKNKHALIAFAKKVGLRDASPAFYYGEIVPEPEYRDDKMEQNNIGLPHDVMPEWWTWRVANWGCKWDCGTLETPPNEFHIPKINGTHFKQSAIHGLGFSFESPWSPPIQVIRKAGLQFPKLAFLLFYEEAGNDFEGEFAMVNGVEEMDDSRTCRPDYDCLIEHFGAEITGGHYKKGEEE